MNIAIIGFGKMGRSIAKFAQKKHKICLIVEDIRPDDLPQGTVHLKNIGDADQALLGSVDVFFEFTTPSSAEKNVLDIIKAKDNAKIICGTTGWDVEKVRGTVEKSNAILFVSSNFSIGVNTLKPCLKGLSQVLSKEGFTASMVDLHHQNKKDAPSGTAKTLASIIEAEGIKCPIQSFREGDYVGTHTIRFESEFEVIELKHIAKNRDVFSIGALNKAEWLKSQSSSGKIFKS